MGKKSRKKDEVQLVIRKGKLYKLIVMDPPWKTEKGGGGRGAQNHYDLLTLNSISEVILQSVFPNGDAAWNPDPDGCMVWCWTTMGALQKSIELFSELGVKYITHMVWVKGHMVDPDSGKEFVLNNFGIGHYMRGQHEVVLFGRIGKTRTASHKTPSILISDKRKHSEKPDEFFEAVTAIAGPGMVPRLEMFARKTRDGWDVWGNEVSQNPT